LGGTLGGAGLTGRSGPQPAFGELVNGRPARVWDVSFRAPESRWAKVSASAFVSDRITLSERVTLMTALRAEVDRGSAEGASSEINWLTITPRVTLRWRPADRLVVTSGYAWYGHRLPLSYLAVGDPSGPTGVMYRWDDRDGDGRHRPSELTAVASVGACCAGDVPSTIDDDVRRPTTGEFRIGFEHAIGSWRWGITGLDRRERQLVALTNVGVTAADYTVSDIDDPGVDIAGRSGFEPLPIYDRRPESALRDAYVLRNTTAQPSRSATVGSFDSEAAPI
jgi:TonB dependent receptor